MPDLGRASPHVTGFETSAAVRLSGNGAVQNALPGGRSGMALTRRALRLEIVSITATSD